MSKQRTRLALAGAAALALIAWISCSGPGAPEPSGPPDSPEADGALVRRPRPSREREVPSAVSEEEPPVAETPAPAPAQPEPAPPARGPRRLEVRVLAPREPAPPPVIPKPAAAEGREGVVVGPEGGVPGGMRMEGWTKWKPVPEKGTVTLRGRVLDAAGQPLEGAEILRVDPAAGGADGEVVEFRHIRPVARSQRDGSCEAVEQPARAVRLAANYPRVMNRPRGLLLHALVSVDPRENEVVAGLELRVPVDARDFGGVAGRVLDDEGAPVRCRVFAGFEEARTDAAGRFRLASVPAGDAEVLVSEYGFRPFREVVPVRPGAETSLEIRLEPRAAGALEVAGVVRDRAGAPLAGVRVWCGGVTNVSRNGATGADGTFRFRRLPAAKGSETYTVSVMSAPDDAGVFPTSLRGIVPPRQDVVLVVERSVMLRIRVQDAVSLAPLARFNVSLERERVIDGERRVVPFRTATLYEEDGTWTVPVPAGGEVTLFVEAPEHRPFHGAVDVPEGGGEGGGDGDGEYEVTIAMQRE